MKVRIDEKLFNLITKSENFEVAYDIKERFESVEERLWHDFFWIDLINKLKSEHTDFITRKTDEWEFIFYHKNWKYFKFYFSITEPQFEFGIGFNYREIKKLYSEIKSDLKDLLKQNFEIRSENNELWFCFVCEDDLTTLKGLKRLLPDNRGEIIAEYCQMFNDLYKSSLDVILKYEKSDQSES